MRTIYIAEPGQQPVTYPEDQVRSMWALRQISTQALYWHEGMPEWRPAPEFFAAPTTAAASPINQTRRWAKDPRQLTQVLRTMFWLMLGLAVISALLSGYSLATGRPTRSGDEPVDLVDFVESLFALGYLGTYLTTVVIFCIWINLANRNARAISAVPMQFTPGWCVGWFFIPIANLWKPMQAMREIWQVSENPAQTPDATTPPQVGTWWTLWLATNLLAQFSLHYSLGASKPNDHMIAEAINLGSNFVEIALCLVAAKLAWNIYQMQKTHVEGA